MYRTRGFLRLAGALAGLACGLAATSASAQTALDEGFATGEAAAAWALWQPAMQAVLDRETELAEQLFGQLLESEPSPFRIALLADRTVSRTALGGAILLLEQDLENDALGPNARRVAEALGVGREHMNEADDGWYFCMIGRFDVAQANFQALLNTQPDPVALLEFTDRVPRRRGILVQLTDNATVGEAARGILRLLEQGEEVVKADPTRIKTRVELLGGPPRAYENSLALLQQSGQYAVPFMLQYLRDPEQQALTRPILRCLPQIGRPALNPLVYALRVKHPLVQRYVVEALGQIGYPQALPYLLQVREQPQTDPEVLAAVEAALAALQERVAGVDPTMSAADAFYWLAVKYYEDAPSLAADPRLDNANVWYWRDELLHNIPVPTQVFNEIMCMRCCEEALRLAPDLKEAEALWVAVNFRRAAQLDEDEVDRTRPENDPSPTYFAQTAGPEICLMALARALDDGDPAVALGVIGSVHNIAGPASIVGDEQGRLPLAEALSFPDRMVRMRAAMTLGNARPTQFFLGYQNLVPVFSEALLLHGGGRSTLIVDPDAASANAVAAVLRTDGYEVVTDAEFFRGLQKVRAQLPALDVICLASDVADVELAAALEQLRGEFRFAATPVVIISKPGDREMVSALAQGDHRLATVRPDDEPDEILAAVARVSRAVGVVAVTPEVGTALALEAAETLRLLAISRNPLFPLADVAPALIETLASDNAELRVTVARVLSYVCEQRAQEALARIALDENEAEELRVDLFGVLAEAAKHCGNLLGDESVDRVIALAEGAENMVIRTAASQALGALNLPANKGSEIIRNQYGG